MHPYAPQRPAIPHEQIARKRKTLIVIKRNVLSNMILNHLMLSPLRRIYPQRLPRLLCSRGLFDSPHHRPFLGAHTLSEITQLHIPRRHALNPTMIRRHPAPPVPHRLPRPPTLDIPICERRRQGRPVPLPPPAGFSNAPAAVVPYAVGVDFAEVAGCAEDEEADES